MLEALEQLWQKTQSDYGSLRSEQLSSSCPIESFAATLNPVFYPAGFSIRGVAMPKAGKQNQHAASFDRKFAVGNCRLEIASSVRDVNKLVSVKYAAVFPRKMVVYRMPPRRVRASGQDVFVTDRCRRAFPRTVLEPVGQINKVVCHRGGDRQRHLLYGVWPFVYAGCLTLRCAISSLMPYTCRWSTRLRRTGRSLSLIRHFLYSVDRTDLRFPGARE